MKPIIIPILLTCSVINAQEKSSAPEQNKIQALTHSSITLEEVLEQNPDAGISTNQNVAAHWMDFDNDNDYDLITVSGDKEKFVCIFSNNRGKYTLVDKSNLDEFSLPEISIIGNLDLNADIAWYDKNEDGFKDFYMEIDGTGYQAEYISNGDGSFQRIAEDLAVNR